MYIFIHLLLRYRLTFLVPLTLPLVIVHELLISDTDVRLLEENSSAGQGNYGKKVVWQPQSMPGVITTKSNNGMNLPNISKKEILSDGLGVSMMNISLSISVSICVYVYMCIFYFIIYIFSILTLSLTLPLTLTLLLLLLLLLLGVAYITRR